MCAQPSPDGDELRARHYLRRLGARPFGHQEPAMPHDDQPRAVTPTQIIPAGVPLPARPPEPGEMPPWYAPPPAPPAPPPPPVPAAPDPGPIEVRHIHEIVLTMADPDPEPDPTRWERLGAWLSTYVRPWQVIVALVLAFAPIPTTGYSAATTWHYTVGLARDSFGPGWGYLFGLGPLALAVTVFVRRGGTTLRLTILAITFIGSFASFSWYDPVLLITGVHR